MAIFSNYYEKEATTLISIQSRSGSATSLSAKIEKFFNKEFHINILGRREGFIDPKQMLVDDRSEDLTFHFRRMDLQSIKIFLVGIWTLQDEVTRYFLLDFLEKHLEQRQLTIKNGRTEVLAYLISKASATKALEEEFKGRERVLFGLLYSKNNKGKFLLPQVFIRIKPKVKPSVQKYTGYCRGYKTSTPAKKHLGKKLCRKIDLIWLKKKYLYQILFDLKVTIDTQLFIAGWTDNYEQIPTLLEYKKKLDYETEIL